jgi:MFS family permease
MAGQVVSQTGGWMARIAQSGVVLQLTDSPAALATVVTIQFLPILLFSLFAGAMADRFPKRRVLVVIQIINIAQAMTLAALTKTGHLELWHVYALAALQGTTNATEQPLRQAFPAELVGRDLIASAIALNSTVMNVARVLGPALGGIVVTTLDFAGAFFLNGVSFGAVLISLALMRLDGTITAPSAARGNPLKGIGESLVYAVRTPAIAFSRGALSCLGMFGFNYSTFLPLLATYQLNLGIAGYGPLSAALGVGAIFGAMAVARVGYTSPVRQVWGGVGFGVILAAIGFSMWLWPTLVLMAALGFAGTVFTTTANTTVQLSVPDAMRGRIMGLYSLLLPGMTPPGAMITGQLADHWNVGLALRVEGFICIVGVLIGLWYYVQNREPRPAAVAGTN